MRLINNFYQLRFFLLVALCFLSACFPHIKKPILPEVAITRAEVNNLLSDINNPDYYTKYSRALYQVKIKEGSNSNSFRYAVISKAPERFRLEALPTSGFYTLSLLIIDRDIASFYDHVNKKSIVSQDVDQLIKDEFSLPIPAEYLPYLFVGRVPLSFIEKTNWQAYNIGNGMLALVDTAFTSYWEIDSSTGSLKKVQFWGQFNEELQLELNFSEYKLVEQLYIPKQLELNVPLFNFEMEFLLQQVKLAEQVPGQLFKQQLLVEP